MIFFKNNLYFQIKEAMESRLRNESLVMDLPGNLKGIRARSGVLLVTDAVIRFNLAGALIKLGKLRGREEWCAHR